MDSLAGKFLIADPTLLDPHFTRSVVLMVQHTAEGAMGLVINRPTELSLKDAWKQVDEGDCPLDGTIHRGGPCEGPLMVLHRQSKLSDLRVTAKLYMSASEERVKELVSRGIRPSKFFVGYAGWSAGQLEKELGEGGWLVQPLEAREVFRTSEDLWPRLVRGATAASLLGYRVPRHVMPGEPENN